MLKALIALYVLAWSLFIVAFTYPAPAQVLHEKGVMNVNTLICNTPEEVQGFIALIEERETVENAIAALPGCGLAQSSTPVKVEHVTLHKTNKATWAIVKYTFLAFPGEQYGLYGLTKNRQTSL